MCWAVSSKDLDWMDRHWVIRRHELFDAKREFIRPPLPESQPAQMSRTTADGLSRRSALTHRPQAIDTSHGTTPAPGAVSNGVLGKNTYPAHTSKLTGPRRHDGRRFTSEGRQRRFRAGLTIPLR